MSRKRRKLLRRKMFAYRAIPREVAIVQPKHKRSKPVRLVCRNEFHFGNSEWKRIDGIWRCVTASIHIAWMKGMDTIAAKIELAKRGFVWEWER